MGIEAYKKSYRKEKDIDGDVTCSLNDGRCVYMD